MSQEFNLIDQYFLPLSQSLSSDEVGIGDDGAVLTPPANHQLVVVTDTMVEGVHFPFNTAASEIAWKAVAVNLSDLAAMGAKPGFISLALTLPDNDQAWLESFASGLTDVCKKYSVPLVGGDTTKGPLTISVTAHGWVESGQALLRSGARQDDIIAVSGVIGDAGLGLKYALNALKKTEQAWLNASDITQCLTALNHPKPQIELGRVLSQFANSAIDISDGLLADLGHVLEQSNKHKRDQCSELGAEIYLDELPISAAMQKWIKQTQEWALPLSAGDDYQLCFTVSAEKWRELQGRVESLGLSIKAIGQMTQGHGVIVKQERGSEQEALKVNELGYQHF